MKYSLKSLVQFKGLSYVLKIPFQDVGLGKAMYPWVSEEILNRIADDLIIKSQNMVVLAKSTDHEYDCFLMDINAGEFNENYRQNCIDLLNVLVGKYLNSSLSSYNLENNLENKPKVSATSDYRFFNPNTTFNLIRAKLSGKDCSDWAKANHFASGMSEVLFDGEVVSTAYVAVINDVNVYSFDKSWAEKYNAQPFQVKDLLLGITNDLIGEGHSLGNYVIGWKFNKEVNLVTVSEALTKLTLNTVFDTNKKRQILAKIFGIDYKSELEALGCKSLFDGVMTQRYDDFPHYRDFLKEKDSLMSIAFEMYWEGIKRENYEGIDFLLLKDFFLNNKMISSDNGAFLKVYFFQILSALTIGKKPKNLELFDLCIKEIAPIFDKVFQKNLCLEFSKIIERDEKNKSLYFGIKVVDEFSDEDIEFLSSSVKDFPGEKEFYVSTPTNSKGALKEIMFFNSDWSFDLKKEVSKNFRRIAALKVADNHI